MNEPALYLFVFPNGTPRMISSSHLPFEPSQFSGSRLRTGGEERLLEREPGGGACRLDGRHIELALLYSVIEDKNDWKDDKEVVGIEGDGAECAEGRGWYYKQLSIHAHIHTYISSTYQHLFVQDYLVPPPAHSLQQQPALVIWVILTPLLSNSK
ncbi:MAG TPA: hypothetical protein VGO47_00230 [Chlamydiales bacterium]|nr:hypothetical protein [Chlamydiales bacterium]